MKKLTAILFGLVSACSLLAADATVSSDGPADFKTVDVEPVCAVPSPTPW